MSDGRGDAEREARERGVRRGEGIGRERLDALAEHFDTTDAGDLPWDEATDVEVKRPELEQVSIRLPREDLTLLKAQAAKMGIGYTTLVRMLLRRHIRESRVKAS